MPQIRIFAKGNVDVRDSLMVCRLGGTVVWNGLNEALRAIHPGVVARVRYETWSRSDALVSAPNNIPAELTAQDLDLGSYTLESQYRSRLFAKSYDAIVLAINPDVMTDLLVHREDGYLFYPGNVASWMPAQVEWLRGRFRRTGLLEPMASMSNIEHIIARLRAVSHAPILIYNMSSIVPGEQLSCHFGLGQALSTRIRRFNLALIDLSAKTGIHIVDVDQLIARAGADAHKMDFIHYRSTGNRLMALETARILEEEGCVDSAAAASAEYPAAC